MVTLKEIANDLGVSIAAVSYVANDKWREKRIHPRLARRITRKLKREDYRPNILGRQLKTKRTQTIGVVLGDLTRNFNLNVLAGIEKVLAASDYFALVCSSDLGRKEADQVRTLPARGVEGLILSPQAAGRDAEKMVGAIVNNGIPVVLVDNYLPRMDVDCVVSDNFAGARDAVTSLLKSGYRRIAYVGYRKSLSALRERFQGYREALESHGIPLADPLVCRRISSPDLTYRALEEIYEHAVPDAIFTESLQYFKGGFRFLFDRHLSIPGDIMVTGFDPADVTLREMNATLLAPAVTGPIPFVEQDGTTMGEEAARILLEKLSGKTESISRLFIKPRLKFFTPEIPDGV